MRKEIYENQESSDTLPFHWEFGKEEITLKVSSYAYGNGIAVLMYSQSEGELELFSDLTVNLPGGYGLKPQEAFVSGDFTRDKLAFIQENRLGGRILQTMGVGHSKRTGKSPRKTDRKKEKRKREIEVYGSKNE